MKYTQIPHLGVGEGWSWRSGLQPVQPSRLRKSGERRQQLELRSCAGYGEHTDQHPRVGAGCGRFAAVGAADGEVQLLVLGQELNPNDMQSKTRYGSEAENRNSSKLKKPRPMVVASFLVSLFHRSLGALPSGPACASHTRPSGLEVLGWSNGQPCRTTSPTPAATSCSSISGKIPASTAFKISES